MWTRETRHPPLVNEMLWLMCWSDHSATLVPVSKAFLKLGSREENTEKQWNFKLFKLEKMALISTVLSYFAYCASFKPEGGKIRDRTKLVSSIFDQPDDVRVWKVRFSLWPSGWGQGRSSSSSCWVWWSLQICAPVPFCLKRSSLQYSGVKRRKTATPRATIYNFFLNQFDILCTYGWWLIKQL